MKSASMKTGTAARTAKISAAVLGAVVALLAGTGLVWAGMSGPGEAVVPQVQEAAAADAAADKPADSFTSHGTEYGKNETVAVKTDLAGNIDSIAVEEWIKNPEGLDSLQDVSSLQNIVSDDEDVTFTREGDTLVWKTGGEDVAYSGTSDAELPFEVTYRFQLDGVDVNPAELKDATGELKVFISYKNKTSATVSTEAGWSYDVQDPFVMASIIQFDAEHAQNVEVDNGTVVDQQGTIIAVGLGMPGLGKTLGLEDMAELPESVEITAQVRGFDMPDIMTVATDQALGGIDRQKTEDVQGQVNDAIGQLNAMTEGLETLSKGNEAIATAAGKIAAGEAAIAEKLPGAAKGLETLAGVAQASNEAVTGAVEAAGMVVGAVQESGKKQAEAGESLQAAAASQQAVLQSAQAGLQAQAQAAAALEGGVSLADAIAEQQVAKEALEAIDVGGLTDDQAEAVRAAVAGLEASIAQTQASGEEAQAAFDDAQAAVGQAQASFAEAAGSAGQALSGIGDAGDALKESGAALSGLAGDDGAAAGMMKGMVVAQKQTEALAGNLGTAAEGIQKVQEGTAQLAVALVQVQEGNKKLGKAATKMGDVVSEAIGTVRGSIDEKTDLVNALSDYVKGKPAYGGSAPDMPASTIYMVHAKAESTPLR